VGQHIAAAFSFSLRDTLSSAAAPVCHCCPNRQQGRLLTSSLCVFCVLQTPLLQCTGFFLFIGLAYYFYHHPPTPLAVTADHLDGLWHELASDVKGLHIGDKASALTHTLTDRWVVL
jgi:hypothetical protein